jgi:hypothetical protein
MIPRCGPSSTQLQNIFFLRSIFLSAARSGIIEGAQLRGL